MKRNAFVTLTLWTLLMTVLLSMVACNMDGQQGANDATTEAETEPSVPALDPAGFGKADDEYVCQDESLLYTYKDKTAEQFAGVCAFYEEDGYALYSESEKAGNLFATYVRDTDMAHVYWLKSKGELCIVLSDTAGGTLPPAASPEIMQGEYTPSITQLRDSSNVNGMCYIIRLPDGSFIVYDGSYEKRGNKVVSQLQELHGEEGTPLVRAWVLTHSHDDHYPAFSYVCNRKADDVKVEYVIFAPIDADLAKQIGGDDYFNQDVHADVAKLGATVVYAHTGMEFSFGDFKMEVLLAADDLFKVGNHNNYFNNSSLVTRIYTQDYSAMFTGDIGKEGAGWMMDVYGEYLQSNVCQVSHHGVENVPLEFYETVQASILYYPCNKWLYDQTERHYDVRMALEQRSYTKEILIAGVGLFTREWGTTFDTDAALSMPEYERK
ncbi:MAG: MBL fold metallo-hydrolase [Clostridia bacterium]|nr:MBL fold metallo-hydrolase [Clostridia bacterium]